MAFSYPAIKKALASRRPKRICRPASSWAAVAVILAPPERPGILMIRRAIHPGDHWSGHIGLPGGRREPDDAGLLATAVRETLEETGVALPADALLGELDDLGPRSAGAPAIVVRPFVFGLPSCPPVTPSDEVAGSFWFPIAELRAHGAGKETTVPGMDRPVRAYLMGSNVVWGLTHRIVAQLLERCEPGLA